MKTADKIASWLLVLMGLMHAGATTVAFPRFNLDAIWFLSAAIAILLTAALNLLRIHYATLVPSLRLVALLANVLMLLLDIAVALEVPLRGNPQVIVLLALLTFLTATSVRPADAAASAR